ncbi:putative nuclear RNA export factor SDE5 [Gossypium hirsutum]|uniref:Nuclear RNA export factor SDE5 n=1 Tax=Gossypium hirsutum TaxID=3635 RepID=A0A1U8KLW2_GOSHI|nr:putative nuclear RNA export factor SDE5 [Gossypium hirsutum]XP_016701709.2 putative nuclear RNA export factor SDE5 [Gossypium hirsutum]
MNCRFDLIRMKGVVISSNPSEAALKELLDAFGSKFSLEEIATAYYEAKGNVSITADILYARNNGRTSKEAVDTYENKSAAANTTSMKLLSGWESETAASPKYTSSNLNSEALKSKRGSVSMGSVSSLIGKNYVKPRPSRMDSLNTTKPVKIDSKEFPASLIWNEEAPSCRTTRNNTKNGDLEKFLFEMLGDGFQLDKSVIQEVLDCCGFDVDKVKCLYPLSSAFSFLSQETRFCGSQCLLKKEKKTLTVSLIRPICCIHFNFFLLINN